MYQKFLNKRSDFWTKIEKIKNFQGFLKIFRKFSSFPATVNKMS